MFYILNSNRDTLSTVTTKDLAIETLGHLSAKFGRIYYAIDPEGKEIARTILPLSTRIAKAK